MDQNGRDPEKKRNVSRVERIVTEKLLLVALRVVGTMGENGVTYLDVVGGSRFENGLKDHRSRVGILRKFSLLNRRSGREVL